MYTHFGDRETVFIYTGTAHVLIKVSCSEGKKIDKGQGCSQQQCKWWAGNMARGARHENLQLIN